jgi:hypothetical protein
MIDHDVLIPRPESEREDEWLAAYRRGQVDVPVCAENGVFSTRYEEVLVEN